MATPLRNATEQFKDKAFVKAYFKGVADGADVTRRLNTDHLTFSAPDLIAQLVQWLEEAEPSDESSEDANARAEQEINAMGLESQKQKEKEAEEKEASKGSGEASDGTTREGQGDTSSPTSKQEDKTPASGTAKFGSAK